MRIVNSVSEYLQYLSSIEQTPRTTYSVGCFTLFRGQANSEWALRTSLERLIENHHPTPSRDKALYYIYESEMIKEFKWKFPSYEKNLIPKDGELIEWLSIMQHFGAPTRLLDFSQSMYVALFMTMDNSFYDNFSIWCI